MINIHSLMASVDAQGSIKTLADHLEFAEKFLDYTGLSKKDGLKINQANLQSLTVAINNHDYYFIQFPQSVNFSLTRPINKDLFLDINEFSHNKSEFLKNNKVC